ncbi:hypothetical protein CR513_32493, partial [Mucuna pruriens]
MTLEITRNYMFYSSIRRVFNFRQGILLEIEYYGTQNGLWIELDQYQGLKMYKVDSIAYTWLVQILRKEKLPSLIRYFLLCWMKKPNGHPCLIKEVPTQKDQPPKENSPQRVVLGNTTSTANDQDI